MSEILLMNYYKLLVLQFLDIGLTLGILYYEYSKSKNWNESIRAERNPIARLIMNITGPKNAWWTLPPVLLSIVYVAYWQAAATSKYWTFYLLGVFSVIVIVNALSLYDAIKFWETKKNENKRT